MSNIKSSIKSVDIYYPGQAEPINYEVGEVIPMTDDEEDNETIDYIGVNCLSNGIIEVTLKTSAYQKPGHEDAANGETFKRIYTTLPVDINYEFTEVEE